MKIKSAREFPLAQTKEIALNTLKMIIDIAINIFFRFIVLFLPLSNLSRKNDIPSRFQKSSRCHNYKNTSFSYDFRSTPLSYSITVKNE